MEASKVLAVGMLWAAALTARAQDSSKDTNQPSPQGASQSAPSQTDPGQPEGPSSNKPVPEKPVQERTGPNSSRTIRHYRVPVDDSQSVELTQAEDAIQKQNYAAAETLLRKAVDRDPKNYVAWFDLGFVENALARIDESVAAYRKSVAAKPDVFESNLNLGLQLAKTGQPDAEHFLRAATLLKPTGQAAEGQFRAWLSLGHVLEKSKPEEALTAYENAATLQPKDAEPHISAGLLLEQAGKFGDAEQEYKQALALDSKSSDALTGLANIYMRGRRFTEAEEYLRKLLAAQPDYAPAEVQLGRVLAAEGKNDEAIVHMQAGIKLTGGDESAQRDLADLYATAGKNEQAESAYRGLLASSPNDPQLHRSLGQALLRQKKFPEAEKEFLMVVKLKSNFGEAYGDLAFAASENKEYPLVIRALEARGKLLPEVPTTYFLRASAYDHLHDLKQAAANYHLFLNSANGKYPEQEW
ncbi:MAG: tetratricopeptide repeat protein, partial [Candidatus Sulfotelmatobacter sp.]